jgi:hypothetical protein
MRKENEILSDIIVWSKYAKYIDSKQRRETWEELVTRNKTMHLNKFPHMHATIDAAYEYVYDKKVLPSMRSLQFGGKAIEVNPVRLFNCSFLPIDHYKAFSETMFLLLSGTGVGYSVQEHNISQLPAIRRSEKTKKYLISDNIEGWADSIKLLMKSYLGLNNWKPKFDYRSIRAKGERLITSGGVAPGPEPLKICLAHIEAILDRKKDGEQLTSIDCHDILCHIADAVLSGGIRRSAMISLFDVDDQAMLTCKFGNWWELNPQRGRSNNSAVIDRSTIAKDEFLNLWKKVEISNSGEPGLYFTNNVNLGTNPCCFTGDNVLLTEEGYASFKDLCNKDFNVVDSDGGIYSGKVWSNGEKETIRLWLGENYIDYITCTADHRFLVDGKEVQAIDTLGKKLTLYKDTKSFDSVVYRIDYVGIEEVFDFNIDGPNHWGVVNGVIAHNCEISLNPFQFCNLVEINASDIETQKELELRTWAGAVIGTLQASYTDFHYLRSEWKKTTEKEALLGIGMTGIASGAVHNLDLDAAAKVGIDTNIEIADRIGVNPAARVTCVKPSGTTSLVLGTSSGIHAWHDQYYIRRIRVGKNEALYTYLSIRHPELLEDDIFNPTGQAVISIPQMAPEGAITRNSENAIDFLNRIKNFHERWIQSGHIYGDNTHNVSATVTMQKEEWPSAGEWIWENKNSFNGLSFMPEDLGSYFQTPFETIDKETYENLMLNLHEIDVTEIIEISDNTSLMDQSGCAGNNCEIK